jgi:thiamine transport system ATP-binding protein
MLEARALTFGGGPIPRHRIDFQVTPGQIMVLSGPSGIGKTTLLNIISGFYTPESGALLWCGKDLLALPVWERPVSFLFQSKNLFDHLSCRINLRFSFSATGSASPDQERLIEDTLSSLGIAHLLDRMPPSLSGGEEQRVALARAVLKRDPVILLDEPFSALDADNRQLALEFVKNVATHHNRAILAVSHNPLDANALSAETLDLSQTRIHP